MRLSASTNFSTTRWRITPLGPTESISKSMVRAESSHSPLTALGPEAEPGTFQAVLRALDDHMVCWDGPMGTRMGNFGIGLYGMRLGDIEQCRRKAAAVKGVARVRTLILQGSEERFEWLDDEIDARIKATVSAA